MSCHLEQPIPFAVTAKPKPMLSKILNLATGLEFHVFPDG